MGKIEKDQFEEFLERNTPVDEPSPAVFARLQKEAVWNRPTASGRNTTVLVALSVLAAVLLWLAFGTSERTIPPQSQKSTPPQIPVKQANDPRPLDVIAANDLDAIGIAKLLKYRSDDFNLSFEKENGHSIFSREYDEI